MSTPAGALAARLALDSSGFTAGMAQAGTVADKELQRITRQVAYATDYIKKMAQAQKTVGDEVKGIQQSANMIEKLGFNTTVARRELIVLGHELSQGNYTKFAGSIGVLAEHSNLLSVAFSAAGLAVIGAVAGVAAFAVAALMGSKESEELRKSLILTGNIAGQTASSFDKLAAGSAAVAGSTLGQGKDAVQALISTGRISQSVMGDAAQAVLLMEKLTGGTAEEVAKDFGKMGEGVARWAAEHNKQYHYLSVEQFKYIKQLEDQGKLEEAEKANFAALNSQMGAVNVNLGYLERAWKAVKESAAGAWEAMKDMGKVDTTAQQIADVQKRINDMQQRGPLNSTTQAAYDKGLNRLKEELLLLQEKARFEQKSATLQSRNAVANEKKIGEIMNPPKSALDPNAWASFISGIEKYNEESAIMAGTAKTVADYDKWAAEQKANLRKETEKLTKAQMVAAQGAVEASRLNRQGAEQIKKATEMEAEMQKLLSDRGLVGNKPDFQTEKNTATNKYLNSLVDDTKRAEALVNGSFQRMEDAVVQFAMTGKLSFSSLWSFMAEEYIRNMVRMAEKKFLTNDAGNFVGWGQAATNVGNWFTGLFAGSHANGLNYVPYDGYPAILHQGERVQTAVQARNSDAGGAGAKIDASINGLSVGAGVSLSQVHSAINQAVGMSQAQIMRSLRQQGVAA